MSDDSNQATSARALAAEMKKWLKVPEAVALYPELATRTIYNWKSSGKLRSRVENGVTVVDAEQLAALVAQRRASATGMPLAGNAASTGRQAAHGATSAYDPEGELTSQAIALFEQGESALDAARKLKVSISTARRIWNEYRDAKSESPGSGPSIADRLTALENRVELQAGDIVIASNNFTLAQDFTELVGEVRQLRAYIERLFAWANRTSRR